MFADVEPDWSLHSGEKTTKLTTLIT